MDINANTNVNNASATASSAASDTAQANNKTEKNAFLGQMKTLCSRHEHHRHDHGHCHVPVRIIYPVVISLPLPHPCPSPDYEKQTKFTKEDMGLLDRNKDNTVEKSEWELMGLDGRLFRYIAGADEKISKEEWEIYVDKQTLQQHQGNAGYWKGMCWPTSIVISRPLPWHRHHHHRGHQGKFGGWQ